MAATPFDVSGPGNSFVFDIYTDGQALRGSTLTFPAGPCNYTDQTLPRCGCRRFWSRVPASRGLPGDAPADSAEVCMCSHHACFHEDIQPGQALPAMPAVNSIPGQENEKPKANREPLTPVQDFSSFQIPANLGASLDLDLLGFQASLPDQQLLVNHPLETVPAPLQLQAEPTAQDSPMPDTFTSWADLLQLQGQDGSSLPQSPAQCFLSSQRTLTSTTSSSQARYLRPFAGKGLQTLSGGSALRQQTTILEEQTEGNREGKKGATGAAPATPGDATPRAPPSQSGSVTETGSATYRKLASTLDSHEQRLERLENTSFSVAGHEDCQDKHESVDLRVTELETRVEEVEKLLNDNGSVASSRRHARHDGIADDATASVVSVSTDATVLASSRAEVYSQLQALQAQVSQLQAAALPSYTKPWELEVAFLPFPLRGIWMEAHEFPTQRRSSGVNRDDWTQMPKAASRSTPDPQSPKIAEWPGQSEGSNWLLPRAFAAGRTIDQRLKSRGLIKTVAVRGPDARSIQLAVHDAFGDILRISSPSSRVMYAPNSPTAEFLGLRQPWVPLRKLHKDSQLRFLSPAEMSTPALWDFTFLISSVVMKATGIHRLYVTQPEAYLQDHPMGYHALETGWTWQKLRELSRVYPDSQSSSGGDVPEADAMEECWAWNDRLDKVPSVNTSAISLRQSYEKRMSRRSTSSPSQQFFTGVQSPVVDNGSSTRRASSPLIHKERATSVGARQLFIRTSSLPPMAPAMSSPGQSRRRMVSHTGGVPYERRSSPFIQRQSQRHNGLAITPAMSNSAAFASKHRLPTRSPSLVPRNTPRWSRPSMSRSPSIAPGGMFGGYDERAGNRATTPFYYATPHSDALPDFYGSNRAGSRGPPAVLRNGYDPDDEGEEGDDDEDMTDSFDGGGGDDGSSTDPYDSQMTGGDPNHDDYHGGSFEQTDNDDIDIDVYEDDDLGGTSDRGAAAWNGFGNQQQTGSAGYTRPEDIPWAGIEDAMEDGENVDPHSSQSQGHDSQALSSQGLSGLSQSQSLDIEIHEDGDEDGAALEGNDDERRSAVSSEAPSEYSSRRNAWEVTPVAPSGSTVPTVIKTEMGLVEREHQEQQGLGGFEIHEDITAGGSQGVGQAR